MATIPKRIHSQNNSKGLEDISQQENVFGETKTYLALVCTKAIVCG